MTERSAAVRRVMINSPLVGQEPTGAAVHLTELLRAMTTLRPEVELTMRHATRRGPTANRDSASRIGANARAVTTPVPTSVLRPLQAGLRFPRERLLAGPFDVYHQFHTDANPAVPSKRLVVTLHDVVALTWPEAEGRMYAGAGRLLRRAAAVITVSRYSKQRICAAFDVDPAQVHVIANGVNHERFTPGTREEAGHDLPARAARPYLLYVGGGTPRKNVPRLIDALAALRRDPVHADLRLLLVGPVRVAESDLRAGAPRDLDQSALEFLGYVSDAEMVALYRNAEAVLCLSLAEGFGMPVLEALACGTPVVASNTTSLVEVSGGATELADPADIDSISATIHRVLSEPAADRIGSRQRGFERAAEFNWTRAARATLALYDHLSSA